MRLAVRIPMRGAALLVSLALPAVALGGAEGPPDGKRGVVAYAPNLRIDWSKRRVEADGEVVLREGMLELFACSPNTREHESIVVVKARPKRLFEALGLIGLTPGHPVRFDESSDRWVPPSGDPLNILVRWKAEDGERTADIGTWMQSIATDAPVPPGVWRFAGSTRNDEGTFLADADGTVICVVDFASALIALAELKSADNDALWVRARTEAIPPVGTPVTLVFCPVEPVAFELIVTREGGLLYDAESVSMKSLLERIRRFEADHESTGVVIHADREAPAHVVERVADALRRAVKASTVVQVVRPDDGVDRVSPSRDSDRP